LARDYAFANDGLVKSEWDIVRFLVQVLVMMLIMTQVKAQVMFEITDESQVRVVPCTPQEMVGFRGVTARLENDLFAGTDRNYTNGVALTVVSRDLTGSLRTECLPSPIRLHAELIKLLKPGLWANSSDIAQSRNVVIRFGQSMFTPEDPLRTDLIVEDRPYAGLLYMGTSWNRRTHAKQSDSERLDTSEFTLGVIGPWALVEQAQNLVHDTLGADRFLGWDEQLSNEPVIQVSVDRKYRGYSGDGAITRGFSTDSIGTIGVRLVNIETSFALGIEGRLGWNIANDFGTYPIRPGAENRPPSAAAFRGTADELERTASGPRAGFHVFSTLELKYVARDFSLDGNSFRSSHHVTRQPQVAQAAFGFSIQTLLAGHGYRLAVMRVYRTREFEEQVSNQAFGSIALSVEF